MKHLFARPLLPPHSRLFLGAAVVLLLFFLVPLVLRLLISFLRALKRQIGCVSGTPVSRRDEEPSTWARRNGKWLGGLLSKFIILGLD